MVRNFLLATSLAAALTTSAYARPLTASEKLRDFEQLVSLMKSGYGPLEFKKRALGIDLETLRQLYRTQVPATASNLDYYYLLNRFVAEFKDSHFAARIPSNHRAHLGFSVDLVQGKVLVDEVNRELLPEADFPYEKGDELIALGGRPVADVMAEIAPYVGMGNPESQKRYAAILLTQRNGARVPVPTGDVGVEFARTDGTRASATIAWKVSGEAPEPDAEFPPDARVRFEERDARDGRHAASWSPQAFKVSIKDVADELAFASAEYSYMCNGGTRVTIPEGATLISESPFVAYYHAHPSDPTVKVGYLRIPHYAPDIDGLGEADAYATRFAQYEYAVAELESRTDALVIDQDHNCGGSVTYLEQIVGLFAKADYDQMQFELLATRASYLEFKSWLDQAVPNTLEYRDFATTVDLVKTTWETGERRLTRKTGFLGTRKNRPHAVRYTKPIVMLIDELSGSGGDAFPAIMGGIGRATLMGQRTMGAGGHVESAGPLYFSGQTLSLTKSLFFRPDGVPVENHGAEPSIPYAPTVNDFINGYKDMQAAYLAEALKLVRAE